MMSKAAYEQKRKFSAQIRVRFNTTTTRIELADATPFGGPTGTYRMRVDRRWCDAADGAPWFINGKTSERSSQLSLWAPLPSRHRGRS